MSDRHLFLLIVLTFFGISCSTVYTASTPTKISRKLAASEGGSGLVINGGGNNPALDLIQSAGKSIDIEIYEMEDSVFLQALKDKAEAGVVVRIIKDPYPVPKADQCLWFPGLKGTNGYPKLAGDTPDSNLKAMPSCKLALDMISSVKSHGGLVEPFFKPRLCGTDEYPVSKVNYCFEHGKMIVVDGVRALVSTGNFNADNFCDEKENPSPSVCNRDFSYLINDAKQVDELRTVFEKDLAEKRYALHPIALPGSAGRSADEGVIESYTPNGITVSPYSLEPLVDFLKVYAMGPSHTVRIQNQYLKEFSKAIPAPPEGTLNDAIREVIKSGATVEIMVSSLCAFGTPTAQDTADAKAIYDSFVLDESGNPRANVVVKYFPAGIHVKDGAGKDHLGYLHAKVMVVDGKYAWMGSVNGSSSALTVNREYGVFFQDPVSVEVLDKSIFQDMHAPKAENFDESAACKYDKGAAAAGGSILVTGVQPLPEAVPLPDDSGEGSIDSGTPPAAPQAPVKHHKAPKPKPSPAPTAIPPLSST